MTGIYDVRDLLSHDTLRHLADDDTGLGWLEANGLVAKSACETLQQQIRAHADTWQFRDELMRQQTQRVTVLAETVAEARTLAFQMQQAALAAYDADDGQTFGLTWVIEKTTRLLEVLQ